MMDELEAEAPGDFAAVGIDAIGQESGNSLMQNRTLPWLQDVPEVNVWGAWEATWRDVVLLDRANKELSRYNLTEHDLTDAANYAELKQRFLDAR